jgi:serine/threonine protein kinase
MKVYGNRWRILDKIDQGGQAEIFLVQDEVHGGGHFVLKRLINQKRVERFRNEIEAGVRLKHPNIAEVIDHDLHGERAYLVMPYYTRGSLEQAEPFHHSDTTALLEIFGKICAGAAYAHAHDVVHRDLKPANILVDDQGQPKIADFGLCLVRELPRVTTASEAVGPRHYMAPELEDGRFDEANARCDVYSLGKVLYWLLSGGRTFSREKYREARFRLPGGADNRYLDNTINRIMFDRMITEDPKSRLHCAGDVVEALAVAVNLIERNVPWWCPAHELKHYHCHRCKLPAVPDDSAICESCGYANSFD